MNSPSSSAPCRPPAVQAPRFLLAPRAKGLAVLTAAAALLVAGCGRHGAPAVAAQPAVAVRVTPVLATADMRYVELPGTVRAVERAALAPKVMGTIQSVAVSLGQRVKRGEVLLRISANEIAARLTQAETGLMQAQRDLERETGLLAKGASAAETVRNLEDRVRLMQATVEEARTMLAYTGITAPFDGVIARKFVNEGDLAAPGVPVLEVENPAQQRVEVEVPDSLAATSVGAEAPVRVGSLELAGRVAELSPASDTMTRTFLAKIDLPAGAAVRSGQFARVSWPAGAAPALYVPVAAVTAFGQMERVFVAAGGRAEMRLVKTGTRRGEQIEILSGLKAGEQVVIGNTALLHDGQPVEVRS